MSRKGKIINYLILAAILLPLIFGAEVAFVEKQYVKEFNQLQAAKLRAEAEVYWLSGQTAYLRGIAKQNAVDTSDPDNQIPDLRSFLTENLAVIGYAQPDGKVQADTSGSGISDISKQNFFAEAIAGREFIGPITGNDWLLNEEVTVIAVPATVNGVVTGVMYGVIRQEVIAALFVNLVPVSISEQEVMGRWLAWLGAMYLLGAIPLLLLVYLLRRPAAAAEKELRTAAAKPYRAATAKFIPPDTQAAGNLKTGFDPASKAEILESMAVKKIEEIIALNTSGSMPDNLSKKDKAPPVTPVIKRAKLATNTKQHDQKADVTPAAVVDKVLAVAAYKGSRAAAQKESIGSSLFEPMSVPVLKTDPSQAVAEPAQDYRAGEITFDNRADFAKKMAGRSGRPDNCFVIISVDGMKVINDFLGNSAGDAIIAAAADILKQVIGTGCIAACKDDDRFIALISGVSPEALGDIKKDIKYYIDLHNVRQPELPLSLTIGTAMASGGESLIAAWERAMQDMESYKAVNRVEARKFIMMSIKRNRWKQ